MVERDDLEHTRDWVAQIAHSQSHVGLLLTDQVVTIDFYDEPLVQMPPALLLRVASPAAVLALLRHVPTLRGSEPCPVDYSEPAADLLPVRR